MKIEYRRIPSYPDYRVSIDGVMIGKRGVMSPAPDYKGVPVVTLDIGHRYAPRKVSRLVAEAWIGSVEDMEVHHIDRVITNNHADNLQILTTVDHKLLHLNDPDYSARGEKINTAKLTEEDVRAIKRTWNGKVYDPAMPKKLRYPDNLSSLVDKYPVSLSSIKRIFTGVSWGHVTI